MLFQRATRLKLRFSTTKGLVSTEDLWDMPLVGGAGLSNLDNIILSVNKELKESASEESFVTKSKNNVNEVLQLKFDVLKAIIDVKKAEKEAADKAKDAKVQRQRIMEILADKQDESLKEKSIEELKEMLEKLG